MRWVCAVSARVVVNDRIVELSETKKKTKWDSRSLEKEIKGKWRRGNEEASRREREKYG